MREEEQLLLKKEIGEGAKGRERHRLQRSRLTSKKSVAATIACTPGRQNIRGTKPPREKNRERKRAAAATATVPWERFASCAPEHSTGTCRLAGGTLKRGMLVEIQRGRKRTPHRMPGQQVHEHELQRLFRTKDLRRS